MANKGDIYKVALPNGDEYNFKDKYVRENYRALNNNDFDTINVTDLNSGNIINTGAARFLNTINGDISGNAATATKATQDSDGSVINTTYAKKSGTTFTGRVAYNNISMPLSAGKVTSLAAGTTEIFKDGIAISNPATSNDVGWIRVTGTGESDTVLEIATGDDGGGSTAEKIVVREYNTSNAVAREAVLLGTDGTTSFPVSVTSPKFIGALQGNADTATKFNSARTVALTGDTTGSTSADGSSGWSVATTTSKISGTAEAAPALVTSPGTGKIRYSYNVNNGTTGLFPTISNANSILTLSKHAGNFHSQLGFSDNGRLYYRSFSNTPLDNTTAWKKIFYDGDTYSGTLTSSQVTTALTYTPLNSSLKGAANGVAELDANGLVPSSQLPSYVDDVQEYTSKSAFPTTGETGKIYVATDTNLTYRWSGSAYVEISPSLALGETSSTAYRGDRGATAYTHATDSNRFTTATASGLYKIASTAQGHIASLTAVTKADITALGIPGSDTTYSAGDNMTLSSTTFYATKRWNAVTQGQKWSRIMYVEPTYSIEGTNGILAVSCTRANVVCNATFIVSTSHASVGKISLVGSTNYSNFNIRVVVNSGGAFYFEIDDTANNIASGTSQTWHCSYLPLMRTTVTVYTAFTDGTTIPSGFTACNQVTTVTGDGVYGIRDITRSGTTFTATRSNGTTFTFTQQDSNDQFTLGTSGNNVVLSKNGTAQNTITVPYATSAGSATKATQDSDGNQINTTYLKLSGGTLTGQLVSTYNPNTSWLSCGQMPDIYINNTGASGWIGGNTKNGRIALCSYASNDNYLYFNYYTDTTLAGSTNKFDKSMKWDGASNTLTTEKYVSNDINSDYYGSSNAITARLTDVNFAGATAGLGKAKMRLDLVTSSMTGAPGNNSAGYLHTYFWDGTTTAMTQIYIPNGDHVTSTNGPQGLMIRGNDNSEWKDWVKIPTGTGWGASGTWGISITGNAATATTASACSGNSATATKATQDGNGNVISSTYVKVTGDPTIFKASDIAEGAANLSTQATAHRITVYRNGMMIPYQMDNANDGGMIRVRGTSESNCIFELGTWDDSGAGETIQFNYYPTTSQVTPTYSVTVPKATGTLSLTNQTISNITRSGTTFTATRADGTTFTFDQKDDDTKYGISASGDNITLTAGGTGTTVPAHLCYNVAIGNTTDWNTLHDAGAYKVQMSSWGDADTYHSPNKYKSDLYSFGILYNVKSGVAAENRLFQYYIPHKTTMPLLVRNHNSSSWDEGWSAWYPIWVGISKSDVGLSNVENKSSATIRGEITSSNVTTALGYTPANSTSLANYLPLAGGTMTGQIVLASTGYKTHSTSGYSVNEYGNFKHQSTSTNEYWVISNNAGTAKLSVYWETGKVVAAGDVQSATVLCANTANSGTAGGLSLYGTDPTQYGVLFRTTANQGGHGYVTSDWATYFTMSNTNNRGWVFRRQSSGNVASIDTSGQMVLNGSLTLGGNATNTSGVRQVYNATTQSLDFVFVA